MESSTKGERRSGRTVLVLLFVFVVVGAIFHVARQNSTLQRALYSVKESAQDAAATSGVRTALLLSKQVSPFDIKVETSHGEVTLQGQVTSEQLKAIAGAIAQDTSGVKQVHNNLGVNPLAERNPETERLGERVADLEIKSLVSDALSKSTEVGEKHIETEVKNRVVTLGGSVETTSDKYAAEQIAWQVPGVQGVKDNLSTTNAQATPESADEQLAHRVDFELYSTKAISLKTMQVHADNGTVTLTGTVTSRAEKLLAERIAQSVTGVRKVMNNLAAPEELQSY